MFFCRIFVFEAERILYWSMLKESEYLNDFVSIPLHTDCRL